MPLDEQSKKLLSEANRRLAVFALLRLEDNSPGRRHRFAKNADPAAGVAKLNAQSLFDTLRPELRFVSDSAHNTVTISDLTFLGYSALSPAQALGKATKSMQILRSSPLLEKLDQLLPPAAPGGLAAAVPTIQQVGGELFRELVKQLDLVVGFDHPRFTAGLTRILQVYLPLANEKLGDHEQIDASALQRWLVRDVALRGQMVKYLLGLEDDEQATRDELTATLAAVAQSREDIPFHTSESSLARQIDAVLSTLADLKAGLNNDAKDTKSYLAQQAGEWVSDIARKAEYNFPHPNTGMGGDFLRIYRAAKAANDWVARFVRTEAMHSFLFCWLASKYRAHPHVDIGVAANEMFRVGVQKVQGRVYAQSRSDVGQFGRQVDDRANEVAEKAKPEAQPFLSVVKERIKSYFLPASAYTREQQLKRATRLFVQACQLAGGRVQELLDASKAHSDAVNVLQQHILKFCSDQRIAANATSDQDTNVITAELKQLLVEKAPGQAAFIEAAFASLPEMTTARAVKVAYVNGFAADVLDKFNTSFNAEYQTILREQEELRHLFGLWCGVALEGKGQTAGLMNVVNLHTTSSEVAAALSEEARKKLPERQIETLKARATAGKSQAFSAIPQQVAEHLRERAAAGPVSGKLLKGEQVVATVTVADQMTWDRAKDTEEAKPSELEDASELILVFGPNPAAPDQRPIEFAFRDLKEAPTNELFPLTTPGGREAVGASKDYDKLAKKVGDCHEKYLEGRADDAAFRRTMRAAKLAQTILAAPRGKVNLDARDLSNILGVMQEMVEKYGDHAAPMFANQPDDANTPEGQRLKEVNLSEFYPLADQDQNDMGKILAFHYKLCGNLLKVAEYLREVRELRDFFDAVAESDLEIEVVNRTLADYVADPDDLFSVEHEHDHRWFRRAPLAVYLTKQAVPQAGDLVNLGAFLTGLVGNPIYPHLQLPLAILASGVGPAPPGVAFPVFAADSVPLPKLELVVGAGGLKGPPPLMWLAALMMEQGCSFGPSYKPKLPHSFNADLHAIGLPAWNVGQESVHHYLRKTWSHTSTVMTALADQVLLLKWTNTALLLGVPFGNWPVWAKGTLAQVYGPPAGAARGPGAAPGPTLYPVLFEGLPIGNKSVNVEVRFGANIALTALNNITGPDTNAILVIDKRNVLAPWAPN